ncbi:hypothetical protein C1I93_03855 [Micromonospora endophytica]|uniref:Uncharacterized protein n=1 Tax=Micromonospora endophytica TaxID=515350 RepID=A0A2W2CQC9_9ACTN|nr:hypothetical protein C1I93_03855 [Micromonospora endophytica]RIW47055.1 hypothetical protein D3H59_10675 [Micromonospora endophytica]
MGVAVWTYIVVKLFVFDVDRYLAAQLGATALRIVDFRLLVFLGFLALTLLLMRRKRTLWLLYVAFFPVVVLLFHFPWMLQRSGSWLPGIAVANIFYSLKQNFRRSFAIRVVELSAMVLILTTPSTAIMYAFAAAIAVALARTYLRTIRGALKPLRFLQGQVAWVGKFLKSPSVLGWASLPAELKRSRARRFNEAQLQKFTQSLGNALLAVKTANFYAYQLERYRRSSFPFVLSFASFGALYLYSIFALTFINLAIYKADASQFAAEAVPSFLTFVHYSLSGLFVNGIDSLSPHGTLALAMQILAGVLGPLLLMTLTLTAIVSFKQVREGEALEGALADIKESARNLNGWLTEEYEVPPGEALRRLQQMGAATAGLVALLASRIPGDFDDYFDVD